MIQQHDTMDASQLRIARGSLPRAPRAPPHRGHCPRALARAQADTHQQTWRAYRFQGMSSEALRKICQAGLVPPLAASLWPIRPRRCQVRAERPYLSSPLWCQRCSRPLQAAHHGASAAARRFGLAPPAATGSAGGAGIQRATQGARGTLQEARALGQGSLDRSCASGNKILQEVAPRPGRHRHKTTPTPRPWRRCRRPQPNSARQRPGA